MVYDSPISIMVSSESSTNDTSPKSMDKQKQTKTSPLFSSKSIQERRDRRLLAWHRAKSGFIWSLWGIAYVLDAFIYFNDFPVREVTSINHDIPTILHYFALIGAILSCIVLILISIVMNYGRQYDFIKTNFRKLLKRFKVEIVIC